MSDSRHDGPPSTFISQWVQTLTTPGIPRAALDVAMGRGRHTALLAGAGYQVYGVDKNIDVLHDARARAAHDGRRIHAWAADLTGYPLPVDRFDLVIVTRYLQRDLFPSLRATVREGGVILYETFTEVQRTLGWGPSSAEHLLAPGELRHYFDDCDVLFYEEVSAPEAVARIATRRRIASAFR